MRYIFILLWLSSLLLATPFKVASYNVENLFDARYQGSEYKEYDPRRGRWNQPLVEKKLNRVAEVICDLDADIIGLQEIENRAIFTALQKRLKRVGCGYDYGVISQRKSRTSVQMALLSRFPITHHKELVVSSSPRVRNILEVELSIAGQRLLVFVNHWKSKGYNGWESKRIKYAKALQRRLSQLSSTTEYLLLGDFNTDYDAFKNLEKKIDDTGGKTGLHSILHTRNRSSQLPFGSHYSLWGELKYVDRWSTKFFSKKGTPDHLILPPALLDHHGISYVEGSFGVFRAKYLFVRAGYIKRWSYKKGGGYSDHLPIFATFESERTTAKPQIPPPPQSHEMTIDQLYGMTKASPKPLLKGVGVVWKRRNVALLKQTPSGRGIFLYGCTKGLEEGRRYDVRVEELGEYRGLKQITYLAILKRHGAFDTHPYHIGVKTLTSPRVKRQNEIVQGVVGVYQKGYLLIQGGRIPLYFKRGAGKPPDGAKIKINYAHIGYYKRLQWVLYSSKDFTVLEQ